MYDFYHTEFGVTVEVRHDKPDTVVVRSGEAQFYNGDCAILAVMIADANPGDLNPSLLQYAQWYDLDRE